MIKVTFIHLPLSGLSKELEIVHRYWTNLKGNRFAPCWSEIDMLQIPSRLLPFTMVKDIENNPRMYRYRFYGSNFAQLNARDLTGQTTDDISSNVLADAVRESLEEFITQVEPQYYQVLSIDEYESTTLQNLLRLPISNDGVNITNILSIVINHVDEKNFKDLLNS